MSWDVGFAYGTIMTYGNCCPAKSCPVIIFLFALLYMHFIVIFAVPTMTCQGSTIC